MSEEFTEASPALEHLDTALKTPHRMIAGADIDGLVSAMMLAAVSDWRIGAFVRKRGVTLVPPGSPHGDLEHLLEPAAMPVYGVDVWSPRFPSVSNHPLLLGSNITSLGDPARTKAVKDLFEDYDAFVDQRHRALASINFSLWIGTRARHGANRPDGLPYRYPLGTAQIVLAGLEVLERAPRLYDRQYLPWMIANCDGGLDSIRQYPWNVEVWWPALAATAGPASHSEAIFSLATSQRPTEFLDIDRRLRWDEQARSASLDESWNIRTEAASDVKAVVDLIRDWTGWPDPFEGPGGVNDLGSWEKVTSTHNALPTETSKLKDAALTPDKVELHLESAKRGVHVNISSFKERGTALGWRLSGVDDAVYSELGSAPDEEGGASPEGEDVAAEPDEQD